MDGEAEVGAEQGRNPRASRPRIRMRPQDSRRLNREQAFPLIRKLQGLRREMTSRRRIEALFWSHDEALRQGKQSRSANGVDCRIRMTTVQRRGRYARKGVRRRVLTGRLKMIRQTRRRTVSIESGKEPRDSRVEN